MEELVAVLRASFTSKYRRPYGTASLITDIEPGPHSPPYICEVNESARHIFSSTSMADRPPTEKRSPTNVLRMVQYSTKKSINVVFVHAQLYHLTNEAMRMASRITLAVSITHEIHLIPLGSTLPYNIHEHEETTARQKECARTRVPLKRYIS